MADLLEDAFFRYMESVVSALQGQRTALALLLAKYPEIETTLLGRVLGDVERSKEFKLLIEATRPLSKWGNSIGWVEGEVKNFFRRSGIYSELQAGRIPEVALALDTYRTAFARTTQRVTHMAPLDFLHMTGNEILCETFRLRKFTKAELEAVLQQQVNRTYYKEAVLELESLHNFWWLIAEEESSIHNSRPNREEPDRSVSMHLTRHSVIETPLKILALYNWMLVPMWFNYFEDGRFDGVWTPPAIPFVLSIHDNFLREPERIKVDREGLHFTGQYNADGSHSDEEGPLEYWDFDEERTEQFATFVRGAEQMIQRVEQFGEWGFIKVALDYLLKGFESKGKEQLVWHIVVLEALLVHKGEAITESIAKRLARILGADESHRKQTATSFRKLYEFRCDVVHGNSAEKKVEWDHLNEARYFARDALVWFLHYLTAVHTHWTKHHPELPLPNRKDLLCFLDLSPSTMRGVSVLSEAMPEGFPHVPEWLE